MSEGERAMANRAAGGPDDPAAERSGIDRLAAACRVPAGITLVVATGIYLTLVWQAPIDSVQGIVQKILYVHPPLAFGAYLGFIGTAVGGFLYLWKGDEQFDRFALSSAEVGVLLCTLMLITGPIWAKATWGRWWSWDLRLTVTLILWFIYLAYLLLRSFSEGGSRAARFSSVYGIVGVLAIPLNYFAIELAGGRTLHPENLERGSLGEGMGWPFAMGALTTLIAYGYLLAGRLEVEDLRRRVAGRAAALEGAVGD
ncbi:MAG: cytochrome c biogenesis protein CcsA [Deltaproteobacteria bacterium]|nr:MAG: cytochrome c biogenesis protein CcsA [Deltaproteobacteria bacterium]